jgi:hypothetical protein
MKTCFDELGISNDSAPELYKWCAKAKDIFRGSLSLLDGRDGDITKLCSDLGVKSNNTFTKEYLDMRDTTVSDLMVMRAGGEKKLTRQNTPGEKQRIPAADASVYLNPGGSTPVKEDETERMGVDLGSGTEITEGTEGTMETGESTPVFKEYETEEIGVDFEPEPEEQPDITIAEDKSEEYSLNEYSFRSVCDELLTLFPDDNAFLIMLNLVEGIGYSEYDTELYEELFTTDEIPGNEYEELLYNKITNTINDCEELDYEIEESQAQGKKKTKKKHKSRKNKKTKRKSHRKNKRKTTRKKKKDDLIDKIIDRLGY